MFNQLIAKLSQCECPWEITPSSRWKTYETADHEKDTATGEHPITDTKLRVTDLETGQKWIVQAAHLGSIDWGQDWLNFRSVQNCDCVVKRMESGVFQIISEYERFFMKRGYQISTTMRILHLYWSLIDILSKMIRQYLLNIIQVLKWDVHTTPNFSKKLEISIVL